MAVTSSGKAGHLRQMSESDSEEEVKRERSSLPAHVQRYGQPWHVGGGQSSGRQHAMVAVV
jgi:hypothetical protein